MHLADVARSRPLDTAFIGPCARRAHLLLAHRHGVVVDHARKVFQIVARPDVLNARRPALAVNRDVAVGAGITDRFDIARADRRIGRAHKVHRVGRRILRLGGQAKDDQERAGHGQFFQHHDLPRFAVTLASPGLLDVLYLLRYVIFRCLLLAWPKFRLFSIAPKQVPNRYPRGCGICLPKIDGRLVLISRRFRSVGRSGYRSADRSAEDFGKCAPICPAGASDVCCSL